MNEREQSIERSLEHQVGQEISLSNRGSLGTIVFGPRNGLGYMYMRAMGVRGIPSATAEFEMIEHAEGVRETIQSMAVGLA